MTQAAPQPVPAPAAVTPLGLLYGQPVHEVPKDLYIPPEALQVFLEAFEGPLDLLLYLIRKQNLNVLDIPMAGLTTQYMQYVEAMQVGQLELAADYLLMAALLIEIKSRMLLPRPADVSDEELDPRAELVRRLLDYEQMKLAAQGLDDLPRAERDFTWVRVCLDKVDTLRLPEVRLDDLRDAWLGLMARARVHQTHTVTREQLSVREHMTRILRSLQGGEYVPFSALFQSEAGVAEMVVSFIAVLELVKESLITVQQEGAYAPIYVRVGSAPDEDLHAAAA